MPFRKRARVTLENRDDKPVVIYYQIDYALTKIPNRFQLVLAATYRARMLSQGHAPEIETKNKPGVTALREIAAGEIGIEMLRKVPVWSAFRHLNHGPAGPFSLVTTLPQAGPGFPG